MKPITSFELRQRILEGQHSFSSLCGSRSYCADCVWTFPESVGDPAEATNSDRCCMCGRSPIEVNLRTGIEGDAGPESHLSRLVHGAKALGVWIEHAADHRDVVPVEVWRRIAATAATVAAAASALAAEPASDRD